MDLKWVQMGAREYHIRSLFKDNTWERLFKKYPEIEEVSFLGTYGTWKTTIPGNDKGDCLEIYLIPNLTILEHTEDKDWESFIETILSFLQAERLREVTLEVKIQTNYLDRFSGWVFREDMPRPVHFWHHRGIQGFSHRVRLQADSERLLSMKSS